MADGPYSLKCVEGWKGYSPKFGFVGWNRTEAGTQLLVGKDRMPRDANLLIRRGLDLLEDVLEIVADVRKRVEGTDEYDRGSSRKIASIEEHKATDEDLSVLSTKELHNRLVVALAEIADIGEELARRAEQRGR